jgi:ATP phosphoribosyltransferase regulatory subunit
MKHDVFSLEALLPAGFHDKLSPDSEIEADFVELLMDVFSTFGYSRVRPASFEFETQHLIGLSGRGKRWAFRALDPVSQQTITLRSDTTPQIARLARTRLRQSTRPLRLSYWCSCVHIHDHQVTQNREFDQVGIELIGPDNASADAEVFVLATEALYRIGLDQLCIDLTLPSLTSLMMDYAGITGSIREQLIDAITRKDIAAVGRYGGLIGSTLEHLIKSTGDIDRSLEAIELGLLPQSIKRHVNRLSNTIDQIRFLLPSLRLTVDLVEFRGLHYELGVSGSIHSLSHQTELGRAGRYLCNGVEPGVGVTLYPESIRRAMPRLRRHELMYLCNTVPIPDANRLRALGYAVVVPSSPYTDSTVEIG